MTTSQCAIPPITYWKQDISITFDDNFNKNVLNSYYNGSEQYIDDLNVFIKTYLYWSEIYYFIDYTFNPLYKIEYYTNSTIVCNNQYDMNMIPESNIYYCESMFAYYAFGGIIPIFFSLMFVFTYIPI